MLQLASFLEIRLFLKETLFPTEIDPFDDLLYLCHSTERCIMLDFPAHGAFDPFLEIGGQSQGR
ncbi:MAG: hypothetical protein IPO91_32075 [Chloroflexi bacterium]|nr:hypothetical protein [Chloroflexota bacterium]